jgi:hypothetical protein
MRGVGTKSACPLAAADIKSSAATTEQITANIFMRILSCMRLID